MAKAQRSRTAAVTPPKGAEAKVLMERAERAIAIRERAAKAREGQRLSFPTRLLRG